MDDRHNATATTTTASGGTAVRDRGRVPHVHFDTVQAGEGRATGGGSPGRLWHTTRALGALALLVTGAIHLQQYIALYSAVPTIGTLFLLNFAGASAIGLALLAPLQRVAGTYDRFLLVPLALAGIGLSAVAFAFLLISEHMPLFGFQEPGYSPPAILAVQITEMATVLFLSAFLIGRARLNARTRRW